MQTLNSFITEIDVLLTTPYITVYQCDTLITDIQDFIKTMLKTGETAPEIQVLLHKLYRLSEKVSDPPKKRSWIFKGVSAAPIERTTYYKEQFQEMKEEISALLFSLEHPAGQHFYSYK